MIFGCVKAGVEHAFSTVTPVTSWARRAHIFLDLWGKNPSDLLYGWSVNPLPMKQYMIDELRLQDHHKIKAYLDAAYGSAELGGIYWVPIEAQALSKIQLAHTECQPFYFTIDLEEDRFALELLARTKNRVGCACIAYASKDQRTWIMDVVDAIFKKLNIAT